MTVNYAKDIDKKLDDVLDINRQSKRQLPVVVLKKGTLRLITNTLEKTYMVLLKEDRCNRRNLRCL